jgi:uncharacterized protein (DUF302 family)
VDQVPFEAGIVSKSAPGTVEGTTEKLVSMLEARGLRLFAIIDHSEEASKVGLSLRQTKVVIFGSPAAGTPVMVASPLAALDLPLKVLIWDDEGVTTVTYTDPAALAARHGLSPEMSAHLGGISNLVAALVSS